MVVICILRSPRRIICYCDRAINGRMGLAPCCDRDGESGWPPQRAAAGPIGSASAAPEAGQTLILPGHRPLLLSGDEPRGRGHVAPAEVSMYLWRMRYGRVTFRHNFVRLDLSPPFVANDRRMAINTVLPAGRDRHPSGTAAAPLHLTA